MKVNDATITKIAAYVASVRFAHPAILEQMDEDLGVDGRPHLVPEQDVRDVTILAQAARQAAQQAIEQGTYNWRVDAFTGACRARWGASGAPLPLSAPDCCADIHMTCGMDGTVYANGVPVALRLERITNNLPYYRDRDADKVMVAPTEDGMHREATRALAGEIFANRTTALSAINEAIAVASGY